MKKFLKVLIFLFLIGMSLVCLCIGMHVNKAKEVTGNVPPEQIIEEF